MSTTHRSIKTFLWIIPLLLAGLACAMPGGEDLPTPPPGTPSAASDGGSGVALPTATLANAIIYPEGAAIDLCAFATPAEVQAVLGATPTKAAYFDGGQACTLSVDDTHFLIVQAGHEADGKAMHYGALEGQRSTITDPSALALLDEIGAQQASLTLPQLVEKALPVWRAAGFTAEPEPGIGDWAYWFYGPQLDFGNLSELGTGRASGAWVALYLPSPDQAAAKAVLKPLAVALLDRLPDDFTPTGNNY